MQCFSTCCALRLPSTSTQRPTSLTNNRALTVFPVPEMLAYLFESVGRKHHTDPRCVPTASRPRTFGVWDGDVHQQKQCMLLQKLPAELRNTIYGYAVSVTYTQGSTRDLRRRNGAYDAKERNREASSPSTHPLALLLTCRLINTEATVILFSTHSFRLTSALPFYGLQQRTSRLQIFQRNAITSLSLAILQLDDTRVPKPSALGAFFTAAILLLPGMEDIVLRVEIDSLSRQALAFSTGTRGEIEANDKHIPDWFADSLEAVMLGGAYALDFFPYRGTKRHCPPDKQRWMEEGFATAGLLIQEEGREVEVRLCYEWEGDPSVEREKVGMGAVRLVPGSAELPVALVNDGLKAGEGFIYMPPADGAKGDYRCWWTGFWTKGK
jgi:hypothetical protein